MIGEIEAACVERSHKRLPFESGIQQGPDMAHTGASQVIGEIESASIDNRRGGTTSGPASAMAAHALPVLTADRRSALAVHLRLAAAVNLESVSTSMSDRE